MYYVYKLRDDQRLVYIGITTRPARRLSEHRCRKHAIGVKLTLLIVAAYKKRTHARAREADLIRTLQPPWNATEHRSPKTLLEELKQTQKRYDLVTRQFSASVKSLELALQALKRSPLYRPRAGAEPAKARVRGKRGQFLNTGARRG